MAYKVKTFFGDYDVEVKTAKYADNGNLAVQLYDASDGCPFARLTVNLGKKLKDGMAYLDTNNCPWAEDFVIENGLGEETGDIGMSGYCFYPLYKFNVERMVASNDE